MSRKTRWLRGCLLGLGLALPSAAWAGDRDWSWFRVNNCATIPPGAQPAPPGTYVNRFIAVQAAIAETDDFVIYKHMWYRGGTELGPLGRYQLDLITRRLPTVPFPVVIETSKNDSLDEQRRDVINGLLAARGYTDPSRIIVAYPIAEGLYGEEAPRIDNLLLFGGGFGGIGNRGFGFGGFGGFNSLGGFGGFGGFGFRGF